MTAFLLASQISFMKTNLLKCHTQNVSRNYFLNMILNVKNLIPTVKKKKKGEKSDKKTNFGPLSRK